MEKRRLALPVAVSAFVQMTVALIAPVLPAARAARRCYASTALRVIAGHVTSITSIVRLFWSGRKIQTFDRASPGLP
jgi:hypothetical protein